jgi:hypothetical protein
MNASLDGVRSACMNFSYRLLGRESNIDIWVEPVNMKKERLWSVTGTEENNSWKGGQVFLGLVSQFRVGQCNMFKDSRNRLSVCA